MSSISNQIRKIESELSGVAKLIAVSKKQPETKLMEAYNSGFKRFGENYAQELVTKAENLPKDIEWHMIGHLQSNKVKFIAPFITLIHSVDSLKLLKEINKQALKNNRIIDCLLQVQIAEEETKTGFDVQGLHQVLKNDLSTMANVRILGLMGMSTFTTDEKVITQEFSTLKQLFDDIKINYIKLPISELSMGMSADYPLAVKNGSTLVRVGSLIFGDRI